QRRVERREPRQDGPEQVPRQVVTAEDLIAEAALRPSLVRHQPHDRGHTEGQTGSEQRAELAKRGGSLREPHRDAGGGERGERLRPLAEEGARDRKSTRLNSSHVSISYAVFC